MVKDVPHIITILRHHSQSYSTYPLNVTFLFSLTPKNRPSLMWMNKIMCHIWFSESVCLRRSWRRTNILWRQKKRIARKRFPERGMENTFYFHRHKKKCKHTFQDIQIEVGSSKCWLFRIRRRPQSARLWPLRELGGWGGGGSRKFRSALQSRPVWRIDETHQFIDAGGWT